MDSSKTNVIYLAEAMDLTTDDTKIVFTDFVEEIVEKILSKLDLVDLMTCYDVNSQFRRIVNGLVKNQNRSCLAVVNFERFDQRNSCSAKYANGKIKLFRVRGYTNMFRFVKLFYGDIRDLTINFLGIDKLRQRELMSYVMTHCHKFLRRLTINNLNTRLRIPNVSFDQVKFLKLVSCLISGTFAHLPKLFPNVEDVSLCGTTHCRNMDIFKIIENYPEVKYMKVTPNLMSATAFELLEINNFDAFFAYSS